jgi:putative ABC transport system permease protein
MSGRRYYSRFYRLASIAVVVMMGVITGSIVLGDSVRGSLADMVEERLGDAQTVVRAGTGYIDDAILRHPLLSEAHGYLLCEGFVSAQGGAMTPVTVWGTDEDGLNEGEVLVNDELAMLTGAEGMVVLHLPADNLVPSGTLFVTQTHTTQLRVAIRGIKLAKRGGDRLLHDEQVRPMNIFMDRRELAAGLGVGGFGHQGEESAPVNVILSSDILTEEDFAKAWHPAYSGISLRGGTVSSERVFLHEGVVSRLQPDSRYLAYFVNSISHHPSSIPYSFVTATDRLHGDEAVLTDYTAERLGASVGDTVGMEYFVVTGGLKRMVTRSHQFTVSDIVPIGQLHGDSLLTAALPGLSGVTRCTDWDSDLPIDMSRITDDDEAYWTQYGQAPKALVSYEAIKSEWTIPGFGAATKVTGVTAERLDSLTPADMGIIVAHPRDAAIHAALHGTDFTGLFLALGFFIILAAMLLMANPLMEMYYLRAGESALFGTLGFPLRSIRRRMFREGAPTLLAFTPLGVAAGFGYAALMLRLLAGAWNGATHTRGFTLHVSPVSMLIGWAAGVIVCLGILVWTIRKCVVANDGAEKKTDGLYVIGKTGNRKNWLTWVILGLVTVLVTLNFTVYHSLILFVVCGILWMAGAGMLAWRAVDSRRMASSASLVANSLRYYRRQHVLAFWTLAAGVFTVLAVGLNRPDVSHSSRQTTGGYELYAETSVPLLYDLNDAALRRRLALGDLPEGTRFLQLARHTEDEASCWNLNRVATPSVLSMPMGAMADFGIDTTKLTSGATDGLIPIAMDSEALTWSMMKHVGDTLDYRAADGREVRALIAAAYPTGVLHGHAIMEQRLFGSLWPEETGSRVVLVAADDDGVHRQAPSASALSGADILRTALSDYGINVTTTAERLARFYEVTDAYLSIFLTLGGLGLLLGVASLLIVMRKYLVARSGEVGLFHVLGFDTDTIVRLFRREQRLVVFGALATGVTGSLISISAGLGAVSRGTWVTATGLVVVLFVLSECIIHLVINPKSIEQQ